MRKHSLLLTLTLCLISFLEVEAQVELKPTSFQNLALEFTKSDITASSSTIMPSVANIYGHASYIDNPASMALIQSSMLSLSFYRQNSSTESFYLENSQSSDNAVNKMGDLSLTYQFPTYEGSLVIGGGYQRLSSDNVHFRISGRNSNNTITDSFLDEASEYHELAFDTYAIDWGDVEQTYLESIFRIGFEPGTFPGINQDAKIGSETFSGEYSAFLATEFRKNLFIGISAGFMIGNYSFARDFLETDSSNDYDGDFIEGSDIASILVKNELEAEFTGGVYRGGLVYKFSNGLNIGASYMLPTKLKISEAYYYSIQTSLDDNSEPFFSELNPAGNFRYRIKKPGILRIGLDYEVRKGMTIAASVEYIDYEKISFDIVSDRDVRIVDIEAWKTEQQRLNNSTEKNNSVLNINAGTSVRFSKNTAVRLGYAFLPGTSEFELSNTHEFSGAFQIGLLDNLQLDLKSQYLFKDSRVGLYNFIDFNDDAQSSLFTSDIHRFRISAGLNLLF